MDAFYKAQVLKGARGCKLCSVHRSLSRAASARGWRQLGGHCVSLLSSSLPPCGQHAGQSPRPRCSRRPRASCSPSEPHELTLPSRKTPANQTVVPDG